MHNALPFIALLACPLSMAAMGAVAWVWARAQRLRGGDNGTERSTTTAGIESS